MPRSRVSVERVRTDGERNAVIEVVRKVLVGEKHWVEAADGEVPEDVGQHDDPVWLMALAGSEPVGCVRIRYDLSTFHPGTSALRPLPGVDLTEVPDDARIAEVGRLLIVPAWRRRHTVVLALMGAVLHETLAAGCTHLVTDTIDDDPHNPFGFHTRRLGFMPIATHEGGELPPA